MCRVFAQWSESADNAPDFLIAKKFSLLKQSECHPKYKQKDGWGIGYLQSKNRPWKMLKSPRPVFTEKQRFKKLAHTVTSPIIFAHIRHASNPKKLPAKKLIRIENCQPFSYQNLIFMHNGTLNIMDEVQEILGPYKQKISGCNDSEVLFWLFVRIWQENADVKDNARRWQKVFKAMIRAIQSVWRKIPKGKRKFAVPYRGLNCVASDGKSLTALCLYDKPEGQSLCGQGRPYFQMCYNIQKDRVVVASEPMDDTLQWEPIPTGHFLFKGLKESKVIIKEL